MSVTYLGDSAQIATSSSSYTYNSLNISTPAPDRRLLMYFMWTTDTSLGGTAAALTSWTLAGAPVQVIGSTFFDTGNNALNIAVGWVTVPEGTTASMQATLNKAAEGSAVSWYRCTGVSATPYEAGLHANTTFPSPMSHTIDVPAGGIAFAIALGLGFGNLAHTWSGMTEDSEVLFTNLSPEIHFSHAHLDNQYAFTDSGRLAVPVTVALSGDGAIGNMFVVSFAPIVNQFLQLTPVMGTASLIGLINDNFSRVGRPFTPLSGRSISELAPLINSNFQRMSAYQMLPVVATSSLEVQIATINNNFARLTI